MTPDLDRAAAATVGEALRALEYDGDTIAGLIGEDAVGGEREEVIVAERRLSESPLETMIRLLYLQLPVAAARLERGVADALVATRLVSRQGERRDRRQRCAAGAKNDRVPALQDLRRDVHRNIRPRFEVCPDHPDRRHRADGDGDNPGYCEERWAPVTARVRRLTWRRLS